MKKILKNNKALLIIIGVLVLALVALLLWVFPNGGLLNRTNAQATPAPTAAAPASGSAPGSADAPRGDGFEQIVSLMMSDMAFGEPTSASVAPEDYTTRACVIWFMIDEADLMVTGEASDGRILMFGWADCDQWKLMSMLYALCAEYESLEADCPNGLALAIHFAPDQEFIYVEDAYSAQVLVSLLDASTVPGSLAGDDLTQGSAAGIDVPEMPGAETPAAGETPAEEAPAGETPAEETPVEETPAEETPEQDE